MAVDPGSTLVPCARRTRPGSPPSSDMGIMLHIFFGTALKTWVGFGCETAELIRRRLLGFGVEPVTGGEPNGREC